MRTEQCDLATFLDKVRNNYPYGIPREAIAAPRAVAEERTPAPRCLFVLILDTPQASASEMELLDAICTKGLKIAREECASVVLGSGASDEEISEAIERARAPLSIVLGSPAALGTVAASTSGVVLHSHPLPVIANDIGAKREFWGLLQGHRP
jgi:hypothetical protein